MRKRNNQPDARREQTLLQIEHTACWLSFWSLSAAVILQTLIGGNTLENIAGECIVLLLLCGYILASSLRHGIWKRGQHPDLRKTLIWSVLGGAVLGVIAFVRAYMLDSGAGKAFLSAILLFLVGGVLVFVSLLTASAVRQQGEPASEEPPEDNP